MAKINDDIRNKVLADWKAGISQNQLSKKFDVSPATINKICKGVEQSNIDLVNTQIAVLTELQSKSEYEVNSIHSVVDDAMRRTNLVYSIQEKALNKAHIMLDQIESPSDLKTIVEAVDKASITLKVSDRHAKSGDVNVQTNTQVNNNHVSVEYVD
ncbi:MAG TPA: helix-turn-helix transcriptional regulator [Methanosarcina sp.]|nr:helix-turn-helix transcriptional regulator [Methanosarcina sp.]